MIPLLESSPGTRRQLTVHRYGTPGRGPKAYLQTGLHADELPGPVVVQHLLPLLDDAATAGRIRGEIVVVPHANPIGLSQYLFGKHAGRFEFDSLGNFNRHYPDLAGPVGDAVAERLTDDAAGNIDLIRGECRRLLAARTPRTEVEHLRLELMKLAVDADIALDLHCDDVAAMHLYLGTPLWPDAADLAAELGAVAVLLAEVSGGEPFDEAMGGIWWQLANRFPDRPVPPACLSATVELRGDRDVGDDLAALDAAALFRFLERRGLIAGAPGPLPPALCDATPLDGTDILACPCGGVLIFHRQVGDRIAAGDTVATILDPTTGARTALISRAAGVLFARAGHPLARPGLPAAKVAGPLPLAHRTGALLTQ
ncbi:succinylglutamate desuccinylase [Zavarzinia compransoris]|uniref:Succinylglutamate desuccinylase n=1 Tax=Zavarzinia compransoris TaxID=1264899 RepID=A0A317DZA6_9PROT|nr:succinylglutamate desuccinylase [Zavarzinia compransoris]